MNLSPRDFLRKVFDAALAAALPQTCLPPYLAQALKLRENTKTQGRVIVIGAGKASAAMAKAVEDHWPQANASTLSGLVLTRYGHAVACKHIEIVEAAHPVPDAAGFAAAQRMLQHTLKDLTEDDLVLCLISGGGSALLALPGEGLTLTDKQTINRALLSCGATITEMNCVRKHLSAIKGGRLALACQPAQVLTLLISDVPNDDPAIIASGPTLPDHTTCADALAILDKYKIPLTAAVREHLATGRGETPKADRPAFARCHWQIIATPQMALETAAKCSAALGIPAHILSDAMEGEAREVAKVHAALARQIMYRQQPFHAPCLLLSGGETTVSFHGEATEFGEGGRNVEFLLALMCELRGEADIYALAADTDGVDGSLDIAGGIMEPNSYQRALALNINPITALNRHDGHGFFRALGDSLITGATYTNVNDFRAVLIYPH